uniref:Histone-lysine N-methyltransferase NSD2 n=1 Tax=Plectus sambesii TaxID=2011161 RepID=A0A914W908_9BILA
MVEGVVGGDAETSVASASSDAKTFEKGDLVLAKLKGHPWWPALIAENPENKEIRRKRVHGLTELHVLFLSDAIERGWILANEKCLLSFTGVADFDSFKQQKMEEAQKKNKMAVKEVEKQFAVVQRHIGSWTRAMRIADRLLAVPNNDRQTSLEWTGKGLSKQIIIKGDLFDESVALERETQRKSRKRPRSSVSAETAPRAKVAKTEKAPSAEEASDDDSSKSENCSENGNAADALLHSDNAKNDPLEDLEGEMPGKDSRITLCLENVPACFLCCQSVDKGEPRVSCSGACKRIFHKSCTDVDGNKSAKFLCGDCSGDGATCLICGDGGKDGVLKCKTTNCRRFYHGRCVAEYRFADHTVEVNNNSFECPSHRCFTCFSYGKDVQASEGPLLGCMRCPVSYHRNDDCVPAGCYLISEKWLVCPLHFDKDEANYAGDFHVNVDHCSDCQKSGELICCDRCPAAFHKECIVKDESNAEDGEFLCTECKLGRFPMYNDIVWAKYGKYRWWPSLVLHPLEIPDRIDNLPHAYGEFVVRFLGTKEHAYISHGRVFTFREGDRPNTGAMGASMRKSFAAGLVEAQKMLDDRKKYRERLEQEQNVQRSNKIPQYRMLKHNQVCAGVKKDAHALDEYPVCSCDPATASPCGGDDQCTNRAMQIECNDECKAGDQCGNKRFAKRQYVIAEPFYTGSRGWGLRCLNDVRKGTFVIEYIGELIGTAEFRRRWQLKLTESERGFYFLTLDKDRVIDAEHAGNMSRFMNHSCEPSCDTFTWQVGNDIRVGLFANRNLKSGEELTFHYNFDSLDADIKTECRCGTPSCCGFIMKKQSKPLTANANGSSTTKSKLSAKKKRAIRSEKYCYCCGDGGTLVCCGKTKCPKVYHLECLKQDKVPEGVWFCPWHYCNDCGKTATRLCSRCEYSWCEKHYHGNFPTPIDFSKPLVCNEHFSTPPPPDPEQNVATPLDLEIKETITAV